MDKFGNTSASLMGLMAPTALRFLLKELMSLIRLGDTLVEFLLRVCKIGGSNAGRVIPVRAASLLDDQHFKRIDQCNHCICFGDVMGEAVSDGQQCLVQLIFNCIKDIQMVLTNMRCL